jgi:hypothetical protein
VFVWRVDLCVKLRLADGTVYLGNVLPRVTRLRPVLCGRMGAVVGIDFDDIFEAVRPNPKLEVRLDVVTVSMVGLALVRAVEHAVDVANGAHGDPSDLHEDTWAESAQLSNDGASVVLTGWKDEETLRSWLQVFAGGLASAGIAGTIRTTPVTTLPESYTGLTVARPSAYVAHDGVITPDDYRANDWCERCTVWARAAGGVGFLGRVAYDQRAPEAGVGAVLHASVLGGAGASFASFSYADDAGARHVSVGADGLTVGQSWDRAGAVLNAVRDLLVALADIAQVGLVAMIPGWVYLWESHRLAQPPLPTIKPARLHRRPELWDDHVPDAHVMQLLSQRHLDLVADLSAWRVTEVAAGRFLVEAADTEPWLREGGPDEATVVRARADFGRAIVSREYS